MRVHFDIIVVSYDPGDSLRMTLDSIYSQDYWDYSVVIEDSESSDGGPVSLQNEGYFDDARRSERTSVYVKKDEGIYDGMNIALSRLKDSSDENVREYVLFLNCGDVLYDRQVLGNIADAADQHIYEDRPYIYYGDLYDMRTKSRVSSAPKLNEFALYRNVPCHQVCFYDLRLFDTRGYDLKYKVRADYEHFLYCVYDRHAVTEYVRITVSGYEGGGYSEKEDNLIVSEKEHREITEIYMGDNAIRYRRRLMLTGAGLRTRMAHNPHFGKIYNKIKTTLYGRRQ